jgi:peroxiredoxin
MGRIGSTLLDANNVFPELNLQLVFGETLKLPEGTAEGYGVVLFYRGYWWPFCNQQLADFQSLIKEFESEQITVIAGSVDPVEKARETVEKLDLTYPVCYAMVVEEISRITGAYYDIDKKFVHATGFLFRPDNTIEVACYSSGPTGRFVPQDVLKLVKFYKTREKSK